MSGATTAAAAPAAPEPGSVTLLGLVGAGAGVVSMRRRRQARPTLCGGHYCAGRRRVRPFGAAGPAGVSSPDACSPGRNPGGHGQAESAAGGDAPGGRERGQDLEHPAHDPI
jgi:hypothetical protein